MKKIVSASMLLFFLGAIQIIRCTLRRCRPNVWSLGNFLAAVCCPKRDIYTPSPAACCPKRDFYTPTVGPNRKICAKQQKVMFKLL